MTSNQIDLSRSSKGSLYIATPTIIVIYIVTGTYLKIYFQQLHNTLL